MYQALIYFFIAVGLSMDAFSLAIAYATNGISMKKTIMLSMSVGLFHYAMPLIGSIVGKKLDFIINSSNIIVGMIFLILAIEMYISKDEEIKCPITNILSIIFFSLTVSLDSFSVGLALSLLNNNIYLAFIIFSITSAIFTLLGLLIGKYLSKKFEKKAIYFGIVILFLLALKYFFI